MKNLVVLIMFALSISCASQKEEAKTSQQTETYKLSEEYSFKIKEIISDSRCPVDVTCVWAGEVELILSIYKEEVFYKEEMMTLNFKNFPENKLLLENYTLNKKIKSIEVLPIKKQGVEISLENYSLKIDLEN